MLPGAICLTASMPIRIAHPTDFPAIAEIWNAVIRDTDLTFTTIEKTADDLANTPILVTGGNRIDGFATYAPFRTGPGYARTAELSIYISPSAQRGGLGTSLLTALEKLAGKQGIHSLIAGIAAANTAAIAFHAAQGYENVGLLPEVGWKNGAWHDLILMQKLL